MSQEPIVKRVYIEIVNVSLWTSLRRSSGSVAKLDAPNEEELSMWTKAYRHNCSIIGVVGEQLVPFIESMASVMSDDHTP